MLDINIDLVYLWVDGNDDNWQEKRSYWAEQHGLKEEIIFNKCRYIDNQELKYSLRSAQMYAPWINNIFIITNGQVPKWLNKNHPKIKLITHEEIMPKGCLPTFNSEAIETCIANIPELSEYFLCANDDKFFASPVTPSDFFDENNNPIIKFRPQTWGKNDIEKSLYKQSYLYTVNTMKQTIKSLTFDYSKYEPFHCIETYRKSYYLECKKEFAKNFQETVSKKFRMKNSIQRPIIDLYMVEKKNCKFQINPKTSEQYTYEQVENLYLSIGNANYMREMIKNKKPKLICINDDELVQDSNRKALKEFLEELFPEIQPWELNENTPIMEEKSTSHIQITFAFDKPYVNNFLFTLNKLINSSNADTLYDIQILTTNLDNSNKTTLKKYIPKNFTIDFYDLNKLNNKTPYVEELNFMNLLASCKPEEKVVCWGASLFLENIINKYQLANNNLLGIIDKNLSRKGEYIGKYKIFIPENISTLKPNKIIVSIINSSEERIREIKSYLRKINYNGGKVEIL